MDELPPRNNNRRVPKPPQQQGSPITPFNRTGKLPTAQPQKQGTSRLGGGTAKLPPQPQRNAGFDMGEAQASPFAVRLDPNGKPGEFNFVIESPEVTLTIPSAHVMEAEASGGIPPVLFRAVDEILGFIYGLDQQFENNGRKGRG